MKNYQKMLSLCLVATFFFSLAPIASADLEDVGGYSAGDKLSRGILNVVSSPVEVGRSIHVTSHTQGAGYGWTIGLLKGVGMAIVRAGAGFVDVLTFPFDFPDENKAPLVQPEYPWQKWNVDYVS